MEPPGWTRRQGKGFSFHFQIARAFVDFALPCHGTVRGSSKAARTLWKWNHGKVSRDSRSAPSPQHNPPADSDPFALTFPARRGRGRQAADRNGIGRNQTVTLTAHAFLIPSMSFPTPDKNRKSTRFRMVLYNNKFSSSAESPSCPKPSRNRALCRCSPSLA
jgi:hypothetical protein